MLSCATGLDWWRSPATAPGTRRFTWWRFHAASVLEFHRSGQFLARQHLGPVGGVINDGRNHGSRLHQVARHGMVVDIHVGVVRDPAVLYFVLDELKSR